MAGVWGNTTTQEWGSTMSARLQSRPVFMTLRTVRLYLLCELFAACIRVVYFPPEDTCALLASRVCL